MAARGSASRNGRSVTVIAPVTGQNSQVIAGGAAGNFTFNVTEPCVLGRLCISAIDPLVVTYDPVDAGQLEITTFTLDADSMISGSPNAAIAKSDATQGISPFLGQQVDQRSTLVLTITNRSAVALTVSVAIAVR